MRKVLLQFHMIPDEIINCLENYRVNKELMILDLGTVREFSIKEYNAESILLRTNKEKSFIIVSQTEINTNCKNQIDFMRKNIGSLYIDIGCKKQGILQESSISGYIEKEKRDLLGLVTFFKKSMKKGCQNINPETGARVKIPSHFYSDGAREFERNGGRLAAIAGETVYSVL